MRAKWYVIVWRLLWIVPLLVSYHIAVVFCALCYGLSAAKRMLRDFS